MRAVELEYVEDELANLKFCQKFCRKRPELWVLMYDNATALQSVIVQEELERQQVVVIPHPPYSPDLAPCDFVHFHRLKENLRGRRFQSA